MIKAMKPISILALLLATTLCGSAQAQLHRCNGADGKVTYTDQPCPSGSTKQRVRVVDNSADSSEHRQKILDDQANASTYMKPDSSESNSSGGSERASSNCPSDREIKNLETKASSITLGKKESDFLQAEIRRAYACRTEGGSYTDSDWQRIRDGQADQGRINPADRARARERTENIHSPRASGQEQDRMISDQRNRALEEAAKEAARKASRPVQLVNCDKEGCWDTSGKRYARSAGGFIRNDGAFCTGDRSTYICR